MPAKKSPSFNPAAFLTDISVGKILVQYPKESVIFPQGKQADAVYYIQKGRVKIGRASCRERV